MTNSSLNPLPSSYISDGFCSTTLTIPESTQMLQSQISTFQMLSTMAILVVLFNIDVIRAQDYEGGGKKELETIDCNGIYLTYAFVSRTKEYPILKNVTAQPWAFKSTATITNTGLLELKNWKIFIGFHNHEILVSAANAVVVDADALPAPVGNGTTLSGFPQTDLKTSVATAGDMTQIQAKVELSGSLFGIRPPGYPMPRTIKLVNDGYKCPAPKRKAGTMNVCCVRDLKAKVKNVTTKYLPREKGDLMITYDVLQAFGNNYLAQVTIDNHNPLGRLDHWNLTWEWMRGEFIYSMRGAYTRKRDISECTYGSAAQYYSDLDFSKVVTCEKKPIIGDLPAEREKDKDVGNVPFCCKNGTLLPTTMNETKSKSIFQLQVFKMPPDLNRTAIYPPEKWAIVGVVNPHYKCGAIRRVDATEFPDLTGLQSVTTAIATWQVICNITRPKKGQSRCCVSYSAYYNDSVVPCSACACGCGSTKRCNANAQLLLPPEALLVPFANRTDKAVSWARIKHLKVPRPLPCPDNCGISINWHLSTNYVNGWSARLTLFNWRELQFVDWFVAVKLDTTAEGFQKAYSFNGTLLKQLNSTIFLTGLPGLNYLMSETNGTHPEKDPRVPGKQQSVITFHKKHLGNRPAADSELFPSSLFFNGEECALPTFLPQAAAPSYPPNLNTLALLACIISFIFLKHLNLEIDPLHLDVTLGLLLTIHNPNHASYTYENSTANVTYRGSPAAEAPLQHDTIPARGDHDISTDVVLNVDSLVTNPGFPADLGAGCLNFTSSTTLHGKAKVLNLFKIKATTYSTCHISVYIFQNNASSVCDSRFKY